METSIEENNHQVITSSQEYKNPSPNKTDPKITERNFLQMLSDIDSNMIEKPQKMPAFPISAKKQLITIRKIYNNDDDVLSSQADKPFLMKIKITTPFHTIFTQLTVERILNQQEFIQGEPEDSPSPSETQIKDFKLYGPASNGIKIQQLEQLSKQVNSDQIPAIESNLEEQEEDRLDIKRQQDRKESDIVSPKPNNNNITHLEVQISFFQAPSYFQDNRNAHMSSPRFSQIGTPKSNSFIRVQSSSFYKKQQVNSHNKDQSMNSIQSKEIKVSILGSPIESNKEIEQFHSIENQFSKEPNVNQNTLSPHSIMNSAKFLKSDIIEQQEQGQINRDHARKATKMKSIQIAGSNREIIIDEQELKHIPIKQIEIAQFDPDRIPPDFLKAQTHQKASHVGPERENIRNHIQKQARFCPCCARHVHRDVVRMCEDNDQLSFLGPGYPLYFLYIKYTILILVILLMVAGIFNMVTNILAACQVTSQQKISNNTSDSQTNTTKIQQTDSSSNTSLDSFSGYPSNSSLSGSTISNNTQCSVTWFQLFNLANQQNNEELMDIQEILNLVIIISFIVALQYLRRAQRKTAQECDGNDISANDYSIMVQGIPIYIKEAQNDPQFDYDDDLQEHMQNEIKIQPAIIIQSVNLAYNIEELVDINQKKAELIQQKQEALKDMFQNELVIDFKKATKVFDEEIEKVNSTKRELQRKFQDGKGLKFMEKYFTGIAFVSFQTEESKKNILKRALRQIQL